MKPAIPSSNRPLSPHLQIYRPQWTSVLSIIHRTTGLVLTAFTLLLVYWLMSLAAGPQFFAEAQEFFGSWLGRLLLLAASFAFFYHFCNGIRHLFWDAGYGFELDTAYKSGAAVVVASLVMTLASWIIALGLRG